MTQYANDILFVKDVYYAGTDTLYTGDCVCYDWDNATTTLASYNVEKPATANLPHFAGTVHESSSGKSTGKIKIHIPIPGTQIPVRTAAACTAGTTKLAITNTSYLGTAASASNVTFALALEGNSTGDTNTIDCRVIKVADVDPAALVTPTQGALVNPAGGTTGGTLAMENVTGATAVLYATIENNLTKVNAQLAKIKVDVAAVITSLKNANLMASS